MEASDWFAVVCLVAALIAAGAVVETRIELRQAKAELRAREAACRPLTIEEVERAVDALMPPAIIDAPAIREMQ